MTKLLSEWTTLLQVKRSGRFDLVAMGPGPFAPTVGGLASGDFVADDAGYVRPSRPIRCPDWTPDSRRMVPTVVGDTPASAAMRRSDQDGANPSSRWTS